MRSSRARASALFATVLFAAVEASALTLGQVDDFQDGTTQSWGSGGLNPNPPVNVSDVGPAGVGDNALQITSTGGIGPGSRFVAFNATQWAGDYPTEGIDTIVMDFNNIGSVALNLRVAFDGAGGRFVTTASFPISAGSGWQIVGLSIAPGDLSSAGGFDVNATLGAVSQLRVISAANPTYEGDSVAAQGLVDNVIAVPEPAEPLMLAAGLGLLGLLWRRRERRAIAHV